MAKEPTSVRRSEFRSEEDSGDAFFDVPAAVLCAFCGRSDCSGCLPDDDQESGVVAIVPWERPGAGAWTRLWATAKATTVGADSFFAALPDGEINPAVRFAIIAELLAVVSMLTLLAPLAAIVFPGLTLELARNPHLRVVVLRWVSVGIPVLAMWMVLAHATHGAALDAGARRRGGRPQRRRALRFGLYACGWDLMSGPLGAAVTLFSSGGRAVGELLSAAARAPGRSSVALLRGVYALSGDDVRRANRTGLIVAVVLSIGSGLAVVAAALIAFSRI